MLFSVILMTTGHIFVGCIRLQKLQYPGMQHNPDYYRMRQQITEHMLGTLKRQLGFTFTLMRGKAKALGEVGHMFIWYNLSRCISVIGAEKFIHALREQCFPCFFKRFQSRFKPFYAVFGKMQIFRQNQSEKNYGLYEPLLYLYELSLVGK